MIKRRHCKWRLKSSSFELYWLIVQKLVRLDKTDVIAGSDLQSCRHFASILQAVMKTKAFKEAEVLLQGQCLDRIYELFNGTLLHFCAKEGLFKCVEWLLSKGASPTVCNADDDTPFHVAIRSGQVNIIFLLAERSDAESFHHLANKQGITLFLYQFFLLGKMIAVYIFIGRVRKFPNQKKILSL